MKNIKSILMIMGIAIISIISMPINKAFASTTGYVTPCGDMDEVKAEFGMSNLTFPAVPVNYNYGYAWYITTGGVRRVTYMYSTVQATVSTSYIAGKKYLYVANGAQVWVVVNEGASSVTGWLTNNGSYGFIDLDTMTGQVGGQALMYTQTNINLSGISYIDASIPDPKINIIAPASALTTGLNKSVPYSFNIQNLNINGDIHIGIMSDSVLANGDIVSKDITYNSAVKDYSGTLTLNMGSGGYKFYVDVTYFDGVVNQTLHKESAFTAINSGNIMNGQDVVTNNPDYNKMISFFKPASGEIIPYGDATNYGIKIDTTYTNTLTGQLLDQYLPPIPEYTGDPVNDASLDQAREQIAILLNGYYDANTKMTFEQLTMATKLNGSKPFEFPWVNNSGIIKSGLNSLVVISVLVNDEKTSFYNYYYQGMWVHAYAGVEFYIENKPDDYNNPTIPTDGGNELPLRENYPEGIVGDVQFGFDTVLYYITFPFKLIGDALYSLGSLIGSAVTSVNNIITPIGTFLDFIPVEVQMMIKLSLISVVLISILKLIRGK